MQKSMHNIRRINIQLVKYSLKAKKHWKTPMKSRVVNLSIVSIDTFDTFVKK